MKINYFTTIRGKITFLINTLIIPFFIRALLFSCDEYLYTRKLSKGEEAKI